MTKSRNQYTIKATHNNKGISHENGAIETAHRSLKHRIGPPPIH